MKEDNFTEDDIRNYYLNVHKSSDFLRRNRRRFTDEEFGEEDWKKEGKKIQQNLNNYSRYLKQLKKALKSAHDGLIEISDGIQHIEEALNDIEKKTEPVYKEIKEVIDNFKTQSYDDDYDDEINIGNSALKINNDLTKELARQRQKGLEELQKTSQLIKSMKEKMEEDIKIQSEMSDDVEKEEPLIKKEEKKEEKNENDEGVKQICGFEITRHRIIVAILVTIIIILVIVAIVIGCKK